MARFQQYQPNHVLNILLIDNNFEFTQKMLQVFKDNEIDNHIVAIDNGLDALDYMLQLGKFKDEEYSAPNIILLNPNLPDINGYSFLSEIKQNREFLAVPVIILSNNLSIFHIRRSYMLGAVSCILKPPVDDLDEFVDAFISYWSKWAKLPQEEEILK